MASPASLDRVVATTLMSILIGIGLLLCGVTIIRGDPPTLVIGTAVATAVFGVLLVCHLKGWQPAPAVLCGILVLLPVAFLTELTPGAAAATLVPPAVATIFTRSRWVLISGFVVVAGVVLRSATGAIGLENATFLLIAGLVVMAMAVARRVLDDAKDRAVAASQAADQARADAEQAAHNTAVANTQLRERTEQQEQLIALLNDLEVPAIQLADRTLLLPLIGAFDSRRAQRLTTTALHSVHKHRAQTLILDIAGMSAVDQQSAKALYETVIAVRLLGCAVVMSGVTAEVARTLAELDLPLADIRFVRQLTDAVLTGHPFAGGHSPLGLRD